MSLCEYPEYPSEYSDYPCRSTPVQIERLITLAHARGTSVPQALVLVCASERHVYSLTRVPGVLTRGYSEY